MARPQVKKQCEEDEQDPQNGGHEDQASETSSPDHLQRIFDALTVSRSTTVGVCIGKIEHLRTGR